MGLRAVGERSPLAHTAVGTDAEQRAALYVVAPEHAAGDGRSVQLDRSTVPHCEAAANRQGRRVEGDHRTAADDPEQAAAQRDRLRIESIAADAVRERGARGDGAVVGEARRRRQGGIPNHAEVVHGPGRLVVGDDTRRARRRWTARVGLRDNIGGQRRVGRRSGRELVAGQSAVPGHEPQRAALRGHDRSDVGRRAALDGHVRPAGELVAGRVDDADPTGHRVVQVHRSLAAEHRSEPLESDVPRVGERHRIEADRCRPEQPQSGCALLSWTCRSDGDRARSSSVVRADLADDEPDPGPDHRAGDQDPHGCERTARAPAASFHRAI